MYEPDINKPAGDFIKELIFELVGQDADEAEMELGLQDPSTGKVAKIKFSFTITGVEEVS